jgi:hypothetical protein
VAAAYSVILVIIVIIAIFIIGRLVPSGAATSIIQVQD